MRWSFYGLNKGWYAQVAGKISPPGNVDQIVPLKYLLMKNPKWRIQELKFCLDHD